MVLNNKQTRIMEFKLKPQVISSFTSWESKVEGVVLVKRKEDIEFVWKALCEQDNYWKFYKNLIKVAPESIEFERDLQWLCEYVGKTDIYDMDAFMIEMRSKGIDVFFYQFINETF